MKNIIFTCLFLTLSYSFLFSQIQIFIDDRVEYKLVEFTEPEKGKEKEKGANIPENIEELLQNKSEKMKLIFRNWPTTMGLLATREFRLGPDNEMDLSEYLDIRAMGKGKKRKSNKNKRS